MTRQLQPTPLISPGFAGLNKQEGGQTSTTGPEFALELQNVVFDSANRVAARKGHVSTAAAGLTAAETVDVLHEFIDFAGVSILIAVTSDFSIFSSADAGATWVDRTGAIVLTSTDVQFVNFADEVVGLEDGGDAFTWDGVAASFVVVVESGGTQPLGNAALSAYGRYWRAGADRQTIQYSGLLNVLDWDSLGVGGAGSIDLANVWTDGTDTIIGIAAFGATLVVFGKKHIIFYIDGSGSLLGIDPTQMYVVDTIEGTGLVARDSIQNIGNSGDIFFLAPDGIQSLLRVQEERTNPLITVSDNIRDFLNDAVSTETGRIHAIHNKKEGFYLLLLPVANKLFMLDTKKRLQGGLVRAAEWTGINPESMLSTTSEAQENIYFGFTADTSKYAGQSDDGTSYRLVYASPHLDLGNEQQPLSTFLKILKRLGSILLVSGDQDIVYKWGFDFKGLTQTLTRTVSVPIGAEYGTAEYGSNGVRDNTDPTLVAGVDISEYGGIVALRIDQVPLDGTARFVQVGLEIEIGAASVAIQELDIYAKLGRMA